LPRGPSPRLVVEHGHKSLVRKTKAKCNGLTSCATTTTMVSREDQSHAIRR